jgi:cellulose synthase/poly-beta-1,6-N-acetylglucosamine synthase-like glycosyltransferase
VSPIYQYICREEFVTSEGYHSFVLQYGRCCSHISFGLAVPHENLLFGGSPRTCARLLLLSLITQMSSSASLPSWARLRLIQTKQRYCWNSTWCLHRKHRKIASTEIVSALNTMQCNAKNLGASGSRNLGLDESAAEYVLFLDDDVVPDPDLLAQYYWRWL